MISIKGFNLICIESNRVLFCRSDRTAVLHIHICIQSSQELLALFQFELSSVQSITIREYFTGHQTFSISLGTHIEFRSSFIVLSQGECHQTCTFFTVYERSKLVFYSYRIQRNLGCSPFNTITECNVSVYIITINIFRINIPVIAIISRIYNVSITFFEQRQFNFNTRLTVCKRYLFVFFGIRVVIANLFNNKLEARILFIDFFYRSETETTLGCMLVNCQPLAILAYPFFVFTADELDCVDSRSIRIVQQTLNIIKCFVCSLECKGMIFIIRDHVIYILVFYKTDELFTGSNMVILTFFFQNASVVSINLISCFVQQSRVDHCETSVTHIDFILLRNFSCHIVKMEVRALYLCKPEPFTFTTRYFVDVQVFQRINSYECSSFEFFFLVQLGIFAFQCSRHVFVYNNKVCTGRDISNSSCYNFERLQIQIFITVFEDVAFKLVTGRCQIEAFATHCVVHLGDVGILFCSVFAKDKNGTSFIYLNHIVCLGQC